MPLTAQAFSGSVRARVRTFIGRSRLKALVRLAKLRHERLRIVIGAGGVCQQGWIPTEVDTLNVLDPDDWNRYFPACSIDALLAEHVWEHLTEEQGFVAARNCYTFLKPGGYVRVAVPDGFHPSAGYLEHVRPGGSGGGADDHKVLHTYRSLSAVFQRVGFAVNLLEYHDEGHRFVGRDWNPEDGLVSRSRRYDRRNRGGCLNFTSVILDATKP